MVETHLIYHIVSLNLSRSLKDEFVTSLAAMALYDGDAEITAAQINTLLAATNNKVAPYWPALFSSFLKGGRIESLIFSGGAGAASGPAGPANDAPSGEPISRLCAAFISI